MVWYGMVWYGMVWYGMLQSALAAYLPYATLHAFDVQVHLTAQVGYTKNFKGRKWTHGPDLQNIFRFIVRLS